METQAVVDLMGLAFRTALLLSAPGLGIALAVGIFVSIFQTVTSINEQTLIFVPKMLGVGLALLVCMSWMVGIALNFTEQVLLMIPALAR